MKRMLWALIVLWCVGGWYSPSFGADTSDSHYVPGPFIDPGLDGWYDTSFGEDPATSTPHKWQKFRQLQAQVKEDWEKATRLLSDVWCTPHGILCDLNQPKATLPPNSDLYGDVFLHLTQHEYDESWCWEESSLHWRRDPAVCASITKPGSITVRVSRQTPFHWMIDLTSLATRELVFRQKQQADQEWRKRAEAWQRDVQSRAAGAIQFAIGLIKKCDGNLAQQQLRQQLDGLQSSVDLQQRFLQEQFTFQLLQQIQQGMRSGR